MTIPPLLSAFTAINTTAMKIAATVTAMIIVRFLAKPEGLEESFFDEFILIVDQLPTKILPYLLSIVYIREWGRWGTVMTLGRERVRIELVD